MDAQNIDRIVREKLTSSDNCYDARANEAQERIWKRIQEKPLKKFPVLLITLAAACFALLLVSSVLALSLMRSKQTTSRQAQTISQLEAKPVAQPPSKINGNLSSQIRIDTVFVVKEKIVTVPALATQPSADTVYIRQIVYREKEENKPAGQTVSKTDAQIEEESLTKSTEILISNGNKPEKDKERRFRIRLGGDQEQTNNGNLALTTRY